MHRRVLVRLETAVLAASPASQDECQAAQQQAEAVRAEADAAAANIRAQAAAEAEAKAVSSWGVTTCRDPNARAC